MRRIEVSPAAIGSLALHVGVAVALMIHLGSRELKVGSVVPVTIVANAPPGDPPPAIQGPQELPAQVETPTPDPLPPTPAPPAPQPTPTPTPPQPTPKTAPPKATQPAPKPVQKGLDLDALDASLSSKTTGGRASNAQKGPARPATSPTPRDTIGDRLAAGQAMRGLTDELQRRWNPNCEVEGGRDVLLSVTFLIGSGGAVSGTPSVEITSARNQVAQAAADRAVSAVFAASPFRNVPREYYGQRVKVNFKAREACAIR